ncbi:MAG: DUF87 domain-containing protein [Microthrixaceae bacterium]
MSRPEGLYVGETTDPTDHTRTGEAVGIDPADLTTHGVIVGMTGSGKTGLGIVLLEEALSQDIPTLIIDPKGDMGNLLLTFPRLLPEDFAPWVPAGADAAETATTWTRGLADWGIDPTDIGALRAEHPMTVYTPGSTAGVPVDLIGSLAPPVGATGAPADAEATHDEIEALVQGLLALVGVSSDPMSGREHVLMANIVAQAWAAGETLDLATLLVRIQDPPMRKLGVIEVDTFFPRKDRTELMLKLNGLLASPSFAAWGQGAPLDIEAMLWNPDGSARAAVIYMAHLSDEERQMVVTRLLSKLVAWMRAQSGSTTLRALVYMDEVYGFVPPTAAPPSKKPLLTLFKQARAFGIGVVLATQNPVDLDYKAISNAGTWLIGRLQTDRDKQRLLDGMSSAAGTVDMAATAATISGLAKREFLLHTTGGKPPRTVGVRWAMSYLAGPLSKDQVGRLPDMDRPSIAAASDVPGSGPTAGATPPVSTPTAVASATGAAAGATHVEAVTAPVAATAEDETPAMPTVAEGTPVRYLDPAAPWAASLGAQAGGPRLQAAIAVRVTLLYDDDSLGVRETEQIEAIFAPLVDSRVDPTKAYSVDYDDRDLRTTAPTGVRYVIPAAPIANKTYFRNIEADVKDHLFRNRTTSVSVNRALKMVARPGETPEEFAQRCRDSASANADADANRIRQKLQARIGKLQQAVTAEQQKAAQLQSQAATSRNSELLSIGGSVLGALFGGRRSARSISSAVNRAASGRARTQRTGDRMEQAMARVEDKTADLNALNDQLAQEITDIVAHWNDVAATIETATIPLEKTDITVDQVALVWVPTT